ncbi:hypothetical protein IMZ48_41130 [Candidatus Bathyarchaeota archaeon]|nr:hypothetical protein [Candidatus Bathyarchaeota archaeon]
MGQPWERDQLANARRTSRFWGILALSAGSFLDLGTRRNNSSKEYFSAEATHARAIALGNGNIPIQSSPFKNSRYCIDTTPALDLIQNSELPRRSQSSLLSNPPSPPVLTGSNTSPLTAATLAAASSGNDEDGAAESSDNYDDPPEGDDDSDDDAVASEDQADSGENEPDEGEYDEGDVEVSSWGDDDEDEDEDDDMPLNWAANPTPTNAATTSVITETAPPVLEQYLPNDMTQPPPGQPIVSMFTANQFAHAQELQGLHQVTRVSSLDNRLPQDATERQEEYVDGQPAPRLGMIYDPHKGMTYHEPADDKRWLTWLKRSKDPNILTAEQNQADIAALGEHTSFFVANTADLRLLTTSSRFVDIYCRGPAEPNLSLPVRVCNHRINMTLHVPELNLVVAACQSGRVALVSLIKGSWALPTVCGDRSMRVDKILPTAAEKAKMKKRLKAPLFGIAMGPVQEVEDGTLRLRARKAPASFSCMYRLVLHFKDHTVLSYLVSRPSPEDLRVI